MFTCVGVSQIDRVVEAVEESLKGNVVHLLAKKKLPRLDLPKVGASHLSCSLDICTCGWIAQWICRVRAIGFC